MPKNITEYLEETEKLNKKNKELQQQLQEAKETIDAIKAGNIDALINADKKILKVYTEKTADKTYRILIEKMHEGAVTINEDGTILYCNSYFANMVNLPLQKVIGTKFKNFIDDSSKESFEAFYKQGKEKVTKVEDYLHTNDGKAIPVLMSVNNFSLDNNFVLSIILTDLSIQNKNQEELKRRTWQLEQKTIELENVNKELALQNEVKEKRAAELVIANKELAYQNDEKEKKAADLIILSEELKTQKEELRKANEQLEKRVFDRTRELENLNHDLKDLNLSKDKFLSVISHDLRNPLTALLIASDQLSQDIDNHNIEKIKPFAKIIHRTSNNILQQLNELVEWAQMQKEKTNLNPEKLHLVSGVDQSLELLKANALQKNIVLENKVPVDLYVNADSLMLRSIIQNLVTNSIKYTPQGGSIKITAQPIDKMVEVCITDSGIGMEADTRENLFTNSNSTSASGTNNEKGSGLGLKLVKDFVTQHGGTIQVESEVGKGTSIIFTVPGY